LPGNGGGSDLQTKKPFMTVTLKVDLPSDLARLKLPAALETRLQVLLDQQDSGNPLTAAERGEAEGLVTMAELLTLLRMRCERLAG
jgi:hypothetical protein